MKGNKLTAGSNMRWESMRMILPEQREEWLKHQHDNKKVKQPVLDEQQWEDFGRIVAECMEYKHLIRFEYWDDGFFYEVIGECHHINGDQKQFHILDTEDEIHYLKFEIISNIESV
ncbi:YolD-like family protein [Geomicrobium sp. JCM 19055]|uniref:YolD-like family protein n=1 Tax=Geomicrobium sp. JCM 19055 TaxID=1460649 RepID=UPI0009DDF888|nr:YolD-like family protein [Geomicrobium sp. JCM 19055]